MKHLLAALGLLLPGAVLAQAPAPAAIAGPACHGCSFSDAIDQRIKVAVSLANNSDSCDFNLLRPLAPNGPATPADYDPYSYGQVYLASKAVGWSAWSGDFCRLNDFLADSLPCPRSLHDRPERLPLADGRLLYLAGTWALAPIVLLEFQGDRFRFIELNSNESGTSFAYELYHHPSHDLLVLTNTNGQVSKIFNPSTTWLSVFDLQQNSWLLDTVVAADNDSQDADALATQRAYKVKDAGRTLVLGNYRDAKGRFQFRQLPRRPTIPRSNHDLLPGTYHLAGGRYQAGPAPAAASPAARPLPPRAAVSAAEVNGTFRDGQGRELAVRALGGGRLQVQFRGGAVRVQHAFLRHTYSTEGTIAGDSATAARPAACALRLHFVRPGTLQVRETGPNCEAEAVGTYQKTSADKPAFN